MKRFIEGEDRTQSTFFPERLDDYISEENPVRVIDVFVDELDLKKLGFDRVVPQPTGAPSYHPSTMLKIYIYGYLNRIQSSRRLERETQRNVELMWLIRRLTPDFKTIADFRKNNRKGIKNVCRTFIGLCRKLDMFTDAVVAIDGSKFKAVNNKENNYTPKKLKFHIERVEKHIQNYLSQLDETDSKEKSESQTTIAEKIAWLKNSLAKLRAIEVKVEATPDKQISTTDPDSRLMKVKGMIRQVSYNVQSAVDTKHHLIVAHEVTNSVSDRSQLCRVGKLAQAALNKKDITVIADKGYFSGQDIKDTKDAGMIPLVPKGDTSGSEKKGIFNRSEFKYNASKDVYICPANKKLQFRSNSIEKGMVLKKYFSDAMTCRKCSMKPNCTKSKGPRRITRWEHEDLLESMEAELKSKPDTMLIRKQTVEHPFGTIKSWMGSTHFLTKGLKNVGTVMNLHVLAYNLKRMITIFVVRGLIKEMMA